MSESDKILKNLETFSHEIRGMDDYNSLKNFCNDLHKDNWAGNKPICARTKFGECPECFACEAGNALLRYEKRAL
jgi:hypothetical protein